MKVDAPPKFAQSSRIETAAASEVALPSAVHPERPLPTIGAAKAPPRVSARLDGVSEKQLRALLARLNEDVSPKSLQLAVNQLATRARQDVRAALKAMLGGDTDAVVKFVTTDHLDFARAELRDIAAKLPPRVVDATERLADLNVGIIAGAVPVPIPTPPPVFGHGYEFALGQRLGMAVGLAIDTAAILSGVGPAAGAGATAIAVGRMGWAAVDASFRGMRMLQPHGLGDAVHGTSLEPQREAVFEARASEPRRIATDSTKHVSKFAIPRAVRGSRRMMLRLFFQRPIRGPT